MLPRSKNLVIALVTLGPSNLSFEIRDRRWRRWEGGGEMLNEDSSSRKDLDPQEERSLCSILGFIHKTFVTLMQGLGQPKLPQIPGEEPAW
jgi:hypothetical protein